MKNKSLKKSLAKSKNVLEEKLKNGRAKNLHKKDQHVYNNCYEFRSRAIKKCVKFKLSTFKNNPELLGSHTNQKTENKKSSS